MCKKNKKAPLEHKLNAQRNIWKRICVVNVRENGRRYFNFFKVKITGVCAFLIKWNKKFQLHIWDRKVISFIIVLTFFFINYSYIYIYIYILASKLINTIKPYPSAHIFVQQPPQLDLIIIWVSVHHSLKFSYPLISNTGFYCKSWAWSSLLTRDQ